MPFPVDLGNFIDRPDNTINKMQLKEKSPFSENNTFTTYISIGIVIFLFLLMEITYQMIFESTIMVLSHIFYFPVIIIPFLYPKKGILISTAVAALYLAIVYLMTSPDFTVIVSATMQFYVYVSVAVLVAIISGKIRRDRIKFRSIFDYSENGICVADEKSGRILEKNKKFDQILKKMGIPESDISLLSVFGKEKQWEDFLSVLNMKNSVENYEVLVSEIKEEPYYALISASKLPEGIIVLSLTDVTDNKRYAEDILRLNRSLTKANNESNLYIDILTHDINNANTAAQGFAELLYETVSDEDRLYFERMMEGIRQSSNIIDKVVLIRDINNSKEVTGPYSLDRAITRALGKYGKNVSWSPSGFMVIAGSYLDSLFELVFENSIFYGGEDVKIEVAACESDEFIEVIVKDNGPGIPDSKKKSLFLRFQPESNSRRGRGLGLSICWLIADMYGGEITAEDTSSGDYKNGLKIVLRLKKA